MKRVVKLGGKKTESKRRVDYMSQINHPNRKGHGVVHDLIVRQLINIDK
jgi:hypothetical protein